MDFALSKENIQPRRGGRNVSQLEVAVQAQTDAEYQRELAEQRLEFERQISSYTGSDPLENWYNFISWIEQSYPKQGHEGNMLGPLEQCLKLFETDIRYRDDPRLCKLLIKFIDHQQEPHELYKKMYNQGICRGCADMYKAWAYYHEAVGDFVNADTIFNYGKRERAQPFAELENAHKNLIFAAGQHIIYGPNEKALWEKRQALTSLHAGKSGVVGSIRNVSGPTPGIFGSAGNSQVNAFTKIYEDSEDQLGQVNGPTSSIVGAARQEVRKENTIKPGRWTSVPVKKRLATQSTAASFTVHEDHNVDTVKMEFPIATSENYLNWIVNLTIPEPVDNRMKPMYPKSMVYAEISTEYSLEEIRGRKYGKTCGSLETVQAVQYIIQTNQIDENSPSSSNINEQNNSLYGISPRSNFKSPIQPLQSPVQMPLLQSPVQLLQSSVQAPLPQSPVQPPQSLIQPPQSPVQPPPIVNDFKIWDSPAAPYLPRNSFNSKGLFMEVKDKNSPVRNLPIKSSTRPKKNPRGIFSQSPVSQESGEKSPLYNAGAPVAGFSEAHHVSNSINFGLWSSPTQNFHSILVNPTEKVQHPNFQIYEQSSLPPQEETELKAGSAMKTPFNHLNAEDLAETGSRGGMDVAAAAPVDSARRLLVDDDDSSSSFDKFQSPAKFGDVSCTTQIFAFNLNAMKVSTPQKHSPGSEEGKVARKQLFIDGEKCDKVLSTILEETKSSGLGSSSSSSSSATTKSLSLGQTKQNNMATISEEHNSYLTQNLMANAALRSSLLGNLMDFGPSTEELPTSKPLTDSPRIPSPAHVTSLDFVPSNPFKQQLIDQLLERVNFPGPHTRNYYCVPNIAKLVPRKEPVSIGSEKYIIEKQLGKGAFGTVFRGVELRTGAVVAVKYQKPANRWEYYICREIQSRLAEHPLRDRFMDARIGYFSDQASILISEFVPCGSLLDVANTVKQKSGRSMKESLCIHFCLEMLKVVQALHDIKIIHADIKPDNFLVHLYNNDQIGLQLIDFGCSIDMSLFPSDAAFTHKVTTEDFTCCEMIDGRPWNYHTDLFCVAATAHVLLFEKYLQLQKKDGHWSIVNRLPRYARLDLWNMFFSTLLNQQNGPADSESLQNILEDALKNKYADYHNEIRYLTNLLKNR